MFTTYSGLDYLKIDIANAAGQDKKLFEQRIDWFNNTIPDSVVTMDDTELMEFCNSFNPDEIDSKELLFTGLKAYQDYWYKRPSGYRCQLDAICSGASIMSCLTADRKGLTNTGLLGEERSDLYSAVLNTMQRLYNKPLIYQRDSIKKAVMCFLYGSIAEPERVFDGNTEIIEIFWKAVSIEASGAYELQQLLINNWNPKATYHHWMLPDAFEVHIPVIVEKEFTHTIIDEDDSFDITFKLKAEGTKKRSVSNCANMVHSIDSMLVREMTRRCMFDVEHAQEVLWYLVNTKEELYEPLDEEYLNTLGQLGVLIYAYENSKFCSVRIIDEIKSQADTYKLSKEHRKTLIDILTKMLHHGYIEMVAIHDCFTSLPNQMNYIRYWYKEMCANIIESNMLSFLYNQLTVDTIEDNKTMAYRKRVASDVRNSNYGLS